MSPALRTILLGVILAVLVIPFGGEAALPGLVVIAALVAFDLWRQSRRPRAG